MRWTASQLEQFSTPNNMEIYLCPLIWNQGAIECFCTLCTNCIRGIHVHIPFPRLSPGLRIKPLSQDGDLAPAIPPGGHNNSVTVQGVRSVLEREGIAKAREI